MKNKAQKSFDRIMNDDYEPSLADQFNGSEDDIAQQKENDILNIQNLIDCQLSLEELEAMMIHVGAIIEELANLYRYEESCYYQQIKDKLEKQKEMWEEK